MAIYQVFLMFYKKQCLRYLILASLITSAEGGYAQSITTPVNNGLNTNVNQVGNQYNITGGTQAGANLFYSLQKLGLSTGEIANFLSNSSVQNILTRVTGGEASLINGLIQVTGGNSNLFIMNPAGIVFGANASLNVPANFSATTASGIQVGNGWFGVNSSVDEVRNLTGNITGYGFTNTLPSLDNTPSSVIVNQGNLSVSTGKSVTLVGGIVVNTGMIATSAGKITIAATSDNKFIKITNEGSLISLELPIADQQVVGNAPVLRGVDLPSLLIGKTSGTAIASGNLDVSGNNGGNVQVLSDKVSLVSANINANGINGGGTVLIGGDLQGTGTTPKSQSTTFDASSTINADALVNGNGGKVILWSDGTTAFDGTITAKGGTLSGNGGLVETSGKNVLTVGNTAQVNTSAFQGETGTWLLDPTTITVVASGGTDATVAAANANAGASTINNSTIVSALNGTNVNLTATNAITVNAAIDSSANGANGNLILTAPTANLNAPITLTGASTLSGTATMVNVGAAGTVQNGVDVSSSGATVNLATTTYALNKTVAIDKNLTINGAGSANTIVDGGGTVRILNIGSINPNITVNINNVMIANGLTNTNFGAGILNFGITNINNSSFTNNKTNFGGAIANLNNGVLMITNSSFSKNSANFGGAILNNGTATIINSSFSENSATTGNGGAVNNNGTATINSIFSKNSAIKDGGAVYNNGKATINNSSFSTNSATVNGGAVSNFDTVTINNSNFSANVATKNGGAFLNNSIATVSNSNFSANVATKNGGAINNNSTATISASTFSDNNAQFGGAILNKGTATISDSGFSRNMASENGGAINNNGTTSIANGTFSSNSATKDGGAVYNNNVVEISGSNFSKNSAQINGGAILNVVTGIIKNSTFSENSASSNGGAINNNGVVEVENSTFSANSATLEGGAIGNKSTIGISNSTFSGNSASNGGAIDSDGKGTILNSTFYGNRAVSGGAIEISSGAPPVSEITITNSILIGNIATTAGNEIFKQNADIITFAGVNIVGTSTTDINGSFAGATPVLATSPDAVIHTTLADNGGATKTHALAFNSIALNASGTGATTSDQRGVVAIGTRDIGAFESKGFTITTTGGTSQSTKVNQAFSSPLIATVTSLDNANIPVNSGTITFTAPNSTATAAFSGLPTATVAISNNIATAPTLTANTKTGNYTVSATATGITTAANFNLTNTADVPAIITPTNGTPQSTIDDPELLRQHKNAIARLFLNQQTSSDFNFNTKLVAFLSSDDREFQRLNSFLLTVIELMNQDGGTLEINTKEIWKDADISIFDQSTNQDVIKVAIRRSIGKFIGNEYIDLVDINFESKKDKKLILLKVRKSPKPAKFLKG